MGAGCGVPADALVPSETKNGTIEKWNSTKEKKLFVKLKKKNMKVKKILSIKTYRNKWVCLNKSMKEISYLLKKKKTTLLLENVNKLFMVLMHRLWNIMICIVN